MEEDSTTPLNSNPKSKTWLFGVIAVIAVLIIGVLFVMKSKKSTPTSLENSTVTFKNISISEVAKHSVTGDCWLAIDGSVYDVSSFVPKHPGEEKILLGCGKDATELFATKAENGIPHSAKAVNMREEFKVGILSGN